MYIKISYIELIFNVDIKLKNNVVVMVLWSSKLRSASIYTCVCVCVCVYIYTTSTPKFFNVSQALLKTKIQNFH